MAPLPLPEGPFDAYLFDCDGTLADSMPLHFRAWLLFRQA
jgi:beta-phosphoglucomutase-like phosphatase (HAD superfamily)